MTQPNAIAPARPVHMTYARQRLWLGISGVGTTVLLCVAAIALDLPGKLISPWAEQRDGTAIAAIALTWIGHALLLLPLDVMGGLVVVRSRPSVPSWLTSWVRGVAVQWVCFALCAAVLLYVGRESGVIGGVLVFVLLQALLLSRQGFIAQLVGGLRVRKASPALEEAAQRVGIPIHAVREVGSEEPSFVGGWTGIGAARLWVPSAWVHALTPEQLRVALARRAGVRSLGLRRRGVLVAVAWNTLGFVLATQLPRADLVSSAGFVTLMAYFTLWTFVGLLVLPSISRPAVVAADRWARRTLDQHAVESAIRQLDAWQDDEEARDPRVETVFHPIPSRSNRLQALASRAGQPEDVTPPHGAWHATRMMLFLSWAGLGGLGRSVHCNVGRPAVWVFLPGD